MGTTPQDLPDGLAAMAPGPGLAAALAGIDRGAVSGFDTVTGLRAARRQANASDAALLAWVVEVELRDPTPEDPMARVEEADAWARDEVRAALALTRAASADLSALATAVVVRLPALYAAMSAGVLTQEKARILTTMTAQLSDAHATAVCAALLPGVEPLSTGQLRDRIAKRAISLDPDWAERRYEAGLKEMRVYGQANDDGTADLLGRNLPKDRVAGSTGRLTAMARAAKHAGDPRPIDHVRSYLYLGMTDGLYAGLTDTEVLAHLAAERLRHAADDDADADPTEAAADPANETPESDPPTDGEPAEKTDAVLAGLEPAEQGPVEQGPVDRADPIGEFHVTPPPEPARSTDPVRPPEPVSPRIGVELQARLSTLMGLDQYPGELAGYGAIHPTYARDLAIALGPAQWRYAITDPNGHLITSGLTPARPPGYTARSWRCQAIVELQIPAALLHALLTRDPSACLRCVAPTG